MHHQFRSTCLTWKGPCSSGRGWRAVAVDDVQRQIQGLPSTVPEMSGPALHFRPERTRLAAGLFARPAFELGSEEEVTRRVAALTDLIALCSLREPRPRRTSPTSFDKCTPVDVTTEAESATNSAGSTLCNSHSFDVMHVDDLCN